LKASGLERGEEKINVVEAVILVKLFIKGYEFLDATRTGGAAEPCVVLSLYSIFDTAHQQCERNLVSSACK
jgi:hypothetical protein